jgi:hypothetical protein
MTTHKENAPTVAVDEWIIQLSGPATFTRQEVTQAREKVSCALEAILALPETLPVGGSLRIRQ